jgi:DNA-binding response OmpR family regulator
MMIKSKNKVVLIVEDDADIRTFVRRVLQLEDYTCLEAETKVETFSSIKENKVDLVILDLRLAENNGWLILSQLKRNRETASIPVIVFTASFGEQQKARALKMGAKEYLIKPLSASVLREAVTRVLPSDR